MSERCLEGVERCRGKVKTISGKVRSGQVQSRRLNAVALRWVEIFSLSTFIIG